MPTVDTLTVQRTAEYRFYAHSHPYVPELIKQLLEGSVRQLQATDTEYRSNADGTLKVMPHSTMAILAAETASTEDPTNLLLRGTPVLLLDSTAIQLKDGSNAFVPGAIEWQGKRGLRLYREDEAPAGNYSWKGKWRVNWGTASGPSGFVHMNLSQNGTVVEGPYEHDNGKIKATATGRILNGRWTQSSGSGQIRFTIAADGNSFEGAYGSGSQPPSIYFWRGTRVTSPTVTVEFGDEIKLAATSRVLRTDGSVVTLPAGTALILHNSKPLPALYDGYFFQREYAPTAVVRQPYPVRDLDFESNGAYSIYNWELFFHVPLTIAIHLSRNQRFSDAMSWFHLLFDPTDNSDAPSPERFWKVKPFQFSDVKAIEELLRNLSTGADPALKKQTINLIKAWQKSPFRPHLIARYRPQSYMYKVVMAYLDNLIAWGDSLFREDSGESINEATQLYVLAANILGPRPQPLPSKGSVRSHTYAKLKKDLNEFGNALVQMETNVPFAIVGPSTAGTDPTAFVSTLRSIGNALYFCVPRNDKLLSYWDTVADRLFKIHNSLNLQGVFRQLPLFEPPIDPALLARATAAGVDVASVVNGLNQPLPLVRFQVLVRHAAELVQEVRQLGDSLLAAMEKQDGEAMLLLRARHERVILDMMEQVRYAQVQEAAKSKEALFKSLALALQRYTYYEMQLGKNSSEITIQVMGALDPKGLENKNLVTAEPEYGMRELHVDIAKDLSDSDGMIISSYEQQELMWLADAAHARKLAGNMEMIAKLMALIPEFGAHVQPIGVGATIAMGGKALSAILGFAADFHRLEADNLTYGADKSAKLGGYFRREQDWAYQSNLAAGEMMQIYKQIRAAELRQAIAEFELKNHRQQMKHAVEIEQFLNKEGANKSGKETNEAFYTWLKREVKGLHARCFQFAFEVARKSERALQHELGDPNLSYVRFDYLAGKEGLLAGQKLYQDIKRMELAYLELNQREFELTRHVSLMQIDPLALIRLRAIGNCTVRLDESLFDMDGPGHYFRRVKSVGVSIPCVTGPYVGVNCTLTLLKSSIRKTPVINGEEYARSGAEDSRFSDYFGSLQSIVTSSGQNDSGLFETNLNDDRYLPFENSGVISEWQLQLPANPAITDKVEPRQFDYDTISDVLLHIRYTAREGGGKLRKGALGALRNAIELGEAVGSVRLFSLRHEFPTAWAIYARTGELTLNLRPEHYPFWSQPYMAEGGLGAKILAADLYAGTDKTSVKVSKEAAATEANTDTLNDHSVKGLVRGALSKTAPSNPITKFSLFFEDKSIRDLWLALRWGK